MFVAFTANETNQAAILAFSITKFIMAYIKDRQKFCDSYHAYYIFIDAPAIWSFGSFEVASCVL